jgi:hypothetical protein
MASHLPGGKTGCAATGTGSLDMTNGELATAEFVMRRREA